jgi:hypothetical protein
MMILEDKIESLDNTFADAVLKLGRYISDLENSLEHERYNVRNAESTAEDVQKKLDSANSRITELVRIIRERDLTITEHTKQNELLSKQVHRTKKRKK